VRHWPWRLAFGVALVAVAWTSLLPPEDLPQDLAVSDKAAHALAYAGLGALAVLSSLRWTTAIVVVVAFGLLVEIAQGMSGYRSFEWADLLADAVGAAVGAAVASPLVRRRRAPDRASGPGSS
jgi:VanZ family protein